jgi:hypothetical protein
MLIRPAEQTFKRGIDALTQGRGLEALALFEAAVELERRHGAARPQARYLSYYGLCLGLETRRWNRGVALCRDAWALESYNADLCHNLVRALIEAGQKGEACEALRRGLGLHRDHPGLLRELQRIGARRCPVLPFLPRSSYLNVWLGRLRHHILG